MKTRDAILLTMVLFYFASIFKVSFAGRDVALIYWMIPLTSLWAATDSYRIQLAYFRSGISYPPMVLFLITLLLWVVVFPWYLSVRYQIKNGTAVLKDGAAGAAI